MLIPRPLKEIALEYTAPTTRTFCVSYASEDAANWLRLHIKGYAVFWCDGIGHVTCSVATVYDFDEVVHYALHGYDA